nr:DUF4283 domain-containing protein [Tanacetum cinerariifolium]
MNNVVMDDVAEGVNRGCNGSEGAEKESKDMDECLGTRDNNNGVSMNLNMSNGEDVLKEDERFPILSEAMNREKESTQANNSVDKNKPDNDLNKSSYVHIVKPSLTSNGNKLSPVQIGIKDGRDVVLFDEELVEEGCKKWKLTLCGYFVGYKMTYMELRYNLFKM